MCKYAFGREIRSLCLLSVIFSTFFHQKRSRNLYLLSNLDKIGIRL